MVMLNNQRVVHPEKLWDHHPNPEDADFLAPKVGVRSPENRHRTRRLDAPRISGWWFQPTPLKNHGVKVSWDYDIPNWMESHKIHSKRPIRIYLSIFSYTVYFPRLYGYVPVTTNQWCCNKHHTTKNESHRGWLHLVSMGLANCQSEATVHGENDDKPMEKNNWFYHQCLLPEWKGYFSSCPKNQSHVQEL